jgi:hypothetical protein
MSDRTKRPKPRRAPKQKFPKGWDEARVQKVLAHYENQTEDEALAEDEAAFAAKGQTVMIVPSSLVPEIRKMIAGAAATRRSRTGRPPATSAR